MQSKLPANFRLDVDRARQVAAKLQEAYQTTGIFGNKEMPEDMLPEGVTPGSEEHLRFITLTVAIDYQRDADQLWAAARLTYADSQTRYLFDPVQVGNTGPIQVVDDMQRYKLSRKKEQDARTWQTICTTLTRRFQGQVGVLIDFTRRDAVRLLDLITSSTYGAGFPFLKGPKIGPLWVRMLHDNCGVALDRIEDVPLPVDIHTAQATLQLGAVQTGAWQGTMADLRKAVQQVWRDALSDPSTGAYPLRMDEPLWLLSRQGCRATREWPCEFRYRCPVAAECHGQQVLLAVEGASNSDGSECKITLR